MLFVAHVCEYIFQDVSNNMLRELPRGIGYLCKVVKLNVSNNKLHSIPVEISSMNGGYIL